jgi:hypothetical protein
MGFWILKALFSLNTIREKERSHFIVERNKNLKLTIFQVNIRNLGEMLRRVSLLTKMASSVRTIRLISHEYPLSLMYSSSRLVVP